MTEVTVQGDHDRLGVAMDALVENAVAHTKPDDLIELSAWIEGGHAVLAVADSGCGIEEEDLAQDLRPVFPGEALSRDVGGFGLGLPTVRAIAEAHKGSVQVRSTVGQGSTFELRIPASAAQASTVLRFW